MGAADKAQQRELTAVKRNLALPDWITPTLSGTWVAFGAPYATPGYWRDSAGIVHLRGVAKSGAVGTTIFTLPAGLRPGFEMIMVSFSGGAFGVIVIQTNGNVVANSGSNASFVLDGMSFRAEQ